MLTEKRWMPVVLSEYVDDESMMMTLRERRKKAISVTVAVAGRALL